MGEVDYKIKIKKVNMLVRKCQINNSVKMVHIAALQISPVKYPLSGFRLKKKRLFPFE